MQVIKQYSVGDRIPDEAKLVATNQYVDYRQKQRCIDFFFLVPEKPKPSSKR